MPSDKIAIYRRVQELLLTVSQTESNARLRGLFAAPKLRPWQAALPDADNQRGRVEALLAYLWDKRAVDGERALALLLNELAAQVSDDRKPKLLILAQALAAHPTAPATSPYRGLFPFRAEDSAFFFGREDVVTQLLDAVQRHPPLVPLLGASGSGKSSVVFAGLLPRLDAIGGWCTLVFRPGRHPLDSLAATLVDALDPGYPTVTRQEEIGKLADGLFHGTLTLEPFLARILQKAPDGTRLLLVADQFEELFTQAPEETHAPFLNTWLVDMPLPLTRLITMRADFLGQALRYPILADALQVGDIKLAPMRPAQLQDAIEEPARLVDVAFEPGLVARILDDLEGAPGNLPLLQFALAELWRRQSWGRMTHAAYEAIGGVEGALAQYAEEVYGALSPGDQNRVRHLFVQLVAPGLGTEDTRRVAERAEMSDEQWALVQRLADHRLVVTGDARDERLGETAELAHEALIQHWQRLRDWMEEDRVFRSWQERLRLQLQQWQQTNRDEGALLRGAPLTEAEGWLDQRAAQFSRTELTFIKASIALREAEAAAREAGTQRLRRRAYWLGGLSLFAVLATVVSLLLFYRARNSEASALAQSTRAAINLAIAQSAEGTAEAERRSAEAERQRAEQQATVAFARQLAAQSLVLQDRQLDRSLLLAVEASAITTTWETRHSLLAAVQTHPQLSSFLRGHSDAVESVAFSPDGNTLASGSDDGTVILWDVASRQQLGEPLSGHSSSVTSVAFSPDGQTLASGSYDHTVIFWDVASRQPLGEPLVGRDVGAISVAFSPDGKTLAFSSDFDTISLWDVASRRLRGEPLYGNGAVKSLAFSPDGQTLASTGGSRFIILRHVASGQTLGEPLYNHSEGSYGRHVAFSPDGNTLAYASSYSTIILWDVTSRQPSGEPLGDHGSEVRSSEVRSVAFSPDGETLASGSTDGTITLWDVASRQPLSEPLAGYGERNWVNVNSVAFSPDGATLASGGGTVVGMAGIIMLWDVASRQPLGDPLVGHSEAAGVNSVAFSPDGKTLAAGSADGTVILWDVASRQPLGEPLVGHNAGVNSVAFSPDGQTLASGGGTVFGDDRTIILWDVASRQPLGEPLVGLDNSVTSVTFSPDGTMLASAIGDGTIILWDVISRQQLGEPLTGHGNNVNSVAFSPDGMTLASGGGQIFGADPFIILWDVASRQPLGGPLLGHDDGVTSVAFSPDGMTVASASFDPTIILWDVSLTGWQSLVCARANRTLTTEEWSLYFADAPDYERTPTCASPPSS